LLLSFNKTENQPGASRGPRRQGRTEAECTGVYTGGPQD